MSQERLKQIELQLVPRWNAIEDDIEAVRNHAQAAIVHAWNVGTLLIEAKKLLGHGNFGLWQTKMDIPSATAARYMMLAGKYATIDDLPDNKREAYLAIGLLPPKDEVDHDGNTQLTPAKGHYLSIYNRWNNWYSQVKSGKFKFEPTPEAKAQLKPMYEWLKGVYEQ